MSIRQGMLALLAEAPMYGARLRSEFEERTGGTWPLNVGQVYTTLARLERDGLVSTAGEDDEGRTQYVLTDAGRAEVDQWWASPVDRSATPRDELVIKLALAVTVPGVDVRRVVQTQRTATMTQLRELTRLKVDAAAAVDSHGSSAELSWLLVVENLIYAAEAEVRWLDHVEVRIARVAAGQSHRARGGRVQSASASAGGAGSGSDAGTDARPLRAVAGPRRQDR